MKFDIKAGSNFIIFFLFILTTNAFAGDPVSLTFLQDVTLSKSTKKGSQTEYQLTYQSVLSTDSKYCSLYITSEEALTIPAGQVFTSQKGHISSQRLYHPLDTERTNFATIDFDKLNGVEVAIDCVDRKNILTQLFLSRFPLFEINAYFEGVIRLQNID